MIPWPIQPEIVPPEWELWLELFEYFFQVLLLYFLYVKD